uniref:Uncharacterized protein n=1 Tax=Hordeum vulgare subsp. vulgare TaxID=112509 RepID=A0A8I6X2G6_HORVV
MVREEDLDVVLVPLGLAVVAGYHLWLLYAILRHPTRTVVGLNALARKRWVAVIMANTEKNGVLAVQTLRNNIMASTVLATTAITLVSVISVFIGATAGRSPASPSPSPLLVYGSTTGRVFAVKYLAISLCFMLAFVCNVQAIRLYAHASFLLPAAGRRGGRRRRGGGVRGVRGAHGERRQPRLVAGPPRLLRLARALHVDLRAHPDARVQRPHVRAALLPRHHRGLRQGDTAHAYAHPWPTQTWHRLSFAASRKLTRETM